MPESVGMNGQIDWQAQQISHLVCSLSGQTCSEAWGTFSTRTGQSIKALIAWWKEECRKEAANIPPSKVENNLSSTRHIGTVLEATLGRLLRDGAECEWAFLSTSMPSWAETETASKNFFLSLIFSLNFLIFRRQLSPSSETVLKCHSPVYKQTSKHINTSDKSRNWKDYSKEKEDALTCVMGRRGWRSTPTSRIRTDTACTWKTESMVASGTDINLHIIRVHHWNENKWG